MGICSTKRSTIITPRHHSSSSEHEGSSPLCNAFMYVQRDNVQNHYKLKQIIGSGYFGNVRLAVRFNGVTNEKFAVKSIAKEKVSKRLLLKRELETLHEVDHPNIIKLYEIYEDDLYLHLVMELCSGGELLDRIMGKQGLPEIEAANLTYQILHAIHHLHSMKISHRDIKAENILYSTTDPASEIKVIDFGLANKFADELEMNSIVGTPYYVAPEVLHKKYGPECDIWSVGVLMYFMLSGRPPFDGDSKKEIYVKILTADYSFEDVVWQTVSAKAKDLIRKLLCKSRKARITADNAMDHAWFKAMLPQDSPKQSSQILKRLSRYTKGSELRKDVMTIISKHLQADEITSLNHIFRGLDRDHTGYIDFGEFQNAISRLEFAHSLDINELFKAIGDGDNRIKYSAFISAAMDRKILLNKEIRWMTFKFFDPDDKGYITVDSMKAALENLEIVVSQEEVIRMIHEAGLKYDQWIDFQEFCKILEPLPDDLSSVSGNNSIESVSSRRQSVDGPSIN